MGKIWNKGAILMEKLYPWSLKSTKMNFSGLSKLTISQERSLDSLTEDRATLLPHIRTPSMDDDLIFCCLLNKVKPEYNKVPKDWQNLFAIKRFRYIKVLFHMLYYYWGKENRLLYRGLPYTKVCYMKVPL